MNKIFKRYNSLGDDFFYHHTRSEGSDAPYLIGPEVHNEYEALYLIEGELSYVIEGQTYKVGKGSLILVSRGEIHTLRISAGSTYERAVILFDMRVIERLFSELNITLSPFITEGRVPVRIISEDTVRRYGIDKTVFSIIGNEKRQEHKKLKMISGLIELLIAIDKIMQDTHAEFIAPHSDDTLVRKVTEFICANIGKQISLDRLAKEFFVSKSTLCHRFSSYMNVTINRYAAIKKIHHASDLIRRGMSAEEAARAVGYDNYTSFYYNFKKIMGKGPYEAKAISGE